ncbi:MAG TPA: DNA polymerase III subunit gamma/tau [Acidisarcina sp.]
MAYQVLARKYRPQRFADVKGQEHVTRTLLNALTQNRIAHGYIFSGHRGIGKTTIARILAMALNCRNEIGSALRPSAEPCDVCESCTEIRAGNAVDVIEIDAATNRGIDEIRELRDAARYRPARDRYKVYILDEAHQITDAAFNALLKTLEEPPDHVIFMMATTQPEDIPQTIRSRCQHFSFHAVRFDDILEQLREIAAREDVIAEDAALALLAEAGDGSMRDALSIMDQAIASAPVEAGASEVDGNGAAQSGRGRPHLDAAQIFELMGTVPNTVFERLMESVSENQSAAVIEETNRLLNAGNSPSQLARQLVRYLRNSLMARLGGESTELLQISPDERARAGRTALLFSEEDLTRFLDIMLRTFDQMNYRQEQRFHLELGLLKLVHLQRLLPMEQFLSQLPAGAMKLSAPGPLGPGSPRTSGSSAGGRAGGTQPADAGGHSPAAAAQAGTASPAARPGNAVGSSTAAVRASPASVQPLPAAAVQSSPTAQPAFSPFEQDRNRRSGTAERQAGSQVASASALAASPRAEIPAQRAVRQASKPRDLTPIEIAARAVQPAVVAGVHGTESSTAAGGTVSAPTVESPNVAAGNVAPAIDTSTRVQMLGEVRASVSALSSFTSSSPAGNSNTNDLDREQDSGASRETGGGSIAIAEEDASAAALDALRDAVCAALAAKGHNTAAALLSSGVWSQTAAAVRVEVNSTKTMLSLAMNNEAEKICKAAMQSLGSTLRLNVVSAEGANGTKAPAANGPQTAARPPATGSAQADALAHPLVQKAQELFSAEVRHVHDLRKR